MKLLVILLFFGACACCARCVSISPERAALFARWRRELMQQLDEKTGLGSTPQSNWEPYSRKGDPAKATTLPPLRKGEYVCGDKICKLRPGEVPKGCQGVCQYPV